MESSLDTKQVDALIEKYRAMGAREQRRVDELDEQNENTLQEICTSLLVPGAAYGMSYARGYFGEKASIWGIPIDAAAGLFMHALAACFDISVDKGSQRAGKFMHDIANGALASWAAGLGRDFGAKKQMEKPLPAPQPHTGAEETPKRAPRPMTYEDLAAIKAAMASNTQEVMPERPPAPAPVHTPPPAPPVVASAKSETAPAASSTPQKAYRFVQRAIDPEAEMRALLQSVGAPSDPNTVAHVLAHEKPAEEFWAIVHRARAPT